jgi:hypothetical protein
MKKYFFAEYSEEISSQMLIFFNGLKEKDRRRYAALESLKLGFGGKAYIARVLDIDARTITHGISELENPTIKKAKPNKERCDGGGRKKKENFILR